MLFCLMAGGFRNAWLGGPVLAALFWLGGFAAWRYEIGALVRAVVLVGTFIGSIAACTWIGLVALDTGGMAMMAIPLWFAGGLAVLHWGWLED